ncbi:MAG TPA: class II aldolase/adducin family protein [Baekduia sp.]|nr:class II aldolase/adducin family protein [Baekduia sp.]
MSDQRSAALRAVRRLASAGLVAGTSGNVSGRTANGMWITPTRMGYADMGVADLVHVGPGPARGAAHAPSSEWRLHLAVYACRPDAGAIVHTHSPFATAWSLIGAPLLDTEDLDYYNLRNVPVVDRLPAGSPALAVATARALDGADAALLCGHGVVAVGPDPERAVDLAHVLERQAAVSWLARLARHPPTTTTEEDGLELAAALARRFATTPS